jgi:chorismate synthase
MQGFEIGSGFAGSRMLGSEHNDEFYMDDGEIKTRSNRCASWREGGVHC